MKLRPLEAADVGLVAGWLAEEHNYQWLDFGGGVQILTPASLRVMMQKDVHCLHLYSPDAEDAPVGLVAFSNINRRFRTATLWYVLGDRNCAGQGYTTQAVARLLRVGFEELGLEAVDAWAVEENRASIRILERNGFLYIGRRRRCHSIEGRYVDRLLFDLLTSEYKEGSRGQERGTRQRDCSVVLREAPAECRFGGHGLGGNGGPGFGEPR